MSTGVLAAYSCSKRQQFAHAGHERRLSNETFKGENDIVCARSPEPGPTGCSIRSLVDQATPAGEVAGIARRSFAAVPSRRRFRRQFGLEVDDVNPLGRILQDLLDRHVDPQIRLPGRDQHRIVVGDAIDGAGAQARYEPEQAVLALDARRPAELVLAEGHPGAGRQEVFADASGPRLPGS